MKKEEANHYGQQREQTAARIKRMRECLGYTQEMVAERAKISVENYKKIEDDSNAMSISSLRGIQRALEVSFDYLLEGDVEPIEQLWQKINASETPVKLALLIRLIQFFARDGMTKKEILDCLEDNLQNHGAEQ